MTDNHTPTTAGSNRPTNRTSPPSPERRNRTQNELKGEPLVTTSDVAIAAASSAVTPTVSTTVSQGQMPPTSLKSASAKTSHPLVTSTTSSGSGVSGVNHSKMTISKVNTGMTNSAPLTLDAQVDAFLLGSNLNMNEPGALPLLRPPNISLDSISPSATTTHNHRIMQTLALLVQHRAWSEILTKTNELLNHSESIYSPLYSQLIHGKNQSSSSSSSTLSNYNSRLDASSTVRKQKDFIQILHWKLLAFHNLKRHYDLCNETSKWKLEELSWIDPTIHIDIIAYKHFFPSTVTSSSNNTNTVTITDENINDSLGGINANNTLSIDYKDKLLLLRNSYEKSRKNQFYSSRIDVVLSNIYIQTQEFRMALVCLDNILKNIPKFVPKIVFGEFEEFVDDFARMKPYERNADFDSHENNDDLMLHNEQFDMLNQHLVSLLTHAVQVEVLSRQGRILLQVGAIPEAAVIFERAYDEMHKISPLVDQCYTVTGSNSTTTTSMYEPATTTGEQLSNVVSSLINRPIVKNSSIQIAINEGLLHFAHMDFELAETKFKTAINIHQTQTSQHDPTLNTTTSVQRWTWKQCHRVDFEDIFGTPEDILAPCLNNLALSSLYTCRMRNAISTLEELIRSNPIKYLSDCIVFNLCTLYELGSDNAVSEKKKQILQMVAKRFALHDIGTESFRLAE